MKRYIRKLIKFLNSDGGTTTTANPNDPNGSGDYDEDLLGGDNSTDTSGGNGNSTGV